MREVTLGGGYFIVVAVNEGGMHIMSLLRNWDEIKWVAAGRSCGLAVWKSVWAEKRVDLFFMMSVAAKFLVAGWRRADFVCVRVCARVVVSIGFVV
jgi:hypothetical protein